MDERERFADVVDEAASLTVAERVVLRELHRQARAQWRRFRLNCRYARQNVPPPVPAFPGLDGDALRVMEYNWITEAVEKRRTLFALARTGEGRTFMRRVARDARGRFAPKMPVGCRPVTSCRRSARPRERRPGSRRRTSRGSPARLDDPPPDDDDIARGAA